ncbi:MAG: hypothetical protein JSW23_01505 [Planctomycetota bacterium]|nr:MAG: hypothetical protein JSW23_01505 [Planctomycetota bacterium]
MKENTVAGGPSGACILVGDFYSSKVLKGGKMRSLGKRGENLGSNRA